MKIEDIALQLLTAAETQLKDHKRVSPLQLLRIYIQQRSPMLCLPTPYLVPGGLIVTVRLKESSCNSHFVPAILWLSLPCCVRIPKAQKGWGSLICQMLEGEDLGGDSQSHNTPLYLFNVVIRFYQLPTRTKQKKHCQRRWYKMKTFLGYFTELSVRLSGNPLILYVSFKFILLGKARAHLVIEGPHLRNSTGLFLFSKHFMCFIVCNKLLMESLVLLIFMGVRGILSSFILFSLKVIPSNQRHLTITLQMDIKEFIQ